MITTTITPVRADSRRQKSKRIICFAGVQLFTCRRSRMPAAAGCAAGKAVAA